jgi:hypothetical protein
LTTVLKIINIVEIRQAIMAKMESKSGKLEIII